MHGCLRTDTSGRELAAFDPDERPVSLRIYGKDPAVIAEAARRVEGMGATICDINMGCPSKKVCKNPVALHSCATRGSRRDRPRGARRHRHS